jgi:dihydroorotate dehydrogenase electron transfer subunit
MAMDDRFLEIVFNRRTSGEVFLMGLRSAEVVAEARPGQFVMIRIGNGSDPLLRRPFSICGSRDGELFLILYKVVGRGTAIMSGLKQGDRIGVLGPLGRGFRTPPTGALSFLVGGGMGIAPLFFMAERFGAEDMILLAGARTAHELISEKNVNIDIKPLIATDDGTRGLKGTAVDLFRMNLMKALGGRKALFACGPLPMLKGLWTLACAENIHFEVSLEASMACGLGACQGCAVGTAKGQPEPYFLVCRDGPVFDALTLNWESL